MKRFFQSWTITTLAVLIAAYLINGIHYRTWLDLLVASLLLGIFNAILRPLLFFLTLPLLIFSLGLFTLVINALLFYFVGFLLRPNFYVENFWAAFWGALIVSISSTILGILTGTGGSRVHVQTKRRPPEDHGSGPVIDV